MKKTISKLWSLVVAISMVVGMFSAMPVVSAATAITANTMTVLNSVTYGAVNANADTTSDLFVAVGDGGRVMKSTDGVTWKNVTMPVTYNLGASGVGTGSISKSQGGVVFNSSSKKFVIIANNAAKILISNAISSNTDALTFTEYTSSLVYKNTSDNVVTTPALKQICYDATTNKYYAIPTAGSTYLVYYSTDAINWKQVTVPTGMAGGTLLSNIASNGNGTIIAHSKTSAEASNTGVFKIYAPDASTALTTSYIQIVGANMYNGNTTAPQPDGAGNFLFTTNKSFNGSASVFRPVVLLPGGTFTKYAYSPSTEPIQPPVVFAGNGSYAIIANQANTDTTGDVTNNFFGLFPTTSYTNAYPLPLSQTDRNSLLQGNATVASVKYTSATAKTNGDFVVLGNSATTGVTYNAGRIAKITLDGTSPTSTNATLSLQKTYYTAPVVSSVTLSGYDSPTTAKVGNILTATPTNDAYVAGVSYRWLTSSSLNGTYTAISGATSSTYTLTAADKDQFVKCEVIPYGTSSDSRTIYGDATLSSTINVLSATAPKITSVSISGSPFVLGNQVTPSYVYDANNGNPEGTSSYTWQISTDGTSNWTTATGANATGTITQNTASSHTYTIASGDAGKYIRFTLTVYDSSSTPVQGETKSSSASNHVIANKPTVTGLYIDRLNTTAGTLQAFYTYVSNGGDGESGTTINWYSSADGYTASIGTGSTYTPTHSDYGKTIKFGVTPVDSYSGAGTMVLSAASLPVHFDNINSLNSVIYASGLSKYIAVGNNGTVLTSTDGDAWTQQNSGTTLNLGSYISNYVTNGQALAYGNNTLVALVNSIYAGNAITSTDGGTTWSAPTNTVISGTQTTVKLNQIVFDSVSGKFWAIDSSVGTVALLYNSVDGINWTNVPNASFAPLKLSSITTDNAGNILVSYGNTTSTSFSFTDSGANILVSGEQVKMLLYALGGKAVYFKSSQKQFITWDIATNTFTSSKAFAAGVSPYSGTISAVSDGALILGLNGTASTSTNVTDAFPQVLNGINGSNTDKIKLSQADSDALFGKPTGATPSIAYTAIASKGGSSGDFVAVGYANIDGTPKGRIVHLTGVTSSTIGSAATSTASANLITTLNTNNAQLNGITTNQGSVGTFSPTTYSYNMNVATTATSITVTPTSTDAGALITVNGASATTPVALNVGPNTVTIHVVSQDGSATQDYTVTVTRASFSVGVPTLWNGVDSVTTIAGVTADLTGKVTVINNGASSLPVVLLMAHYNNGTLVNVVPSVVTSVAAGQTTELTAVLTGITVPTPNTTDSIKLFVWGDLVNIVPLQSEKAFN